MKKILLFNLIIFSSLSQEAIQGTIYHDNLEREYENFVELLS